MLLSTRPWSAALTGDNLEDAEDGDWDSDDVSDYQGYVVRVWTFDTKEQAIQKAKSLGGANVMRGTQMENEPLGQVEERRRPIDYRWYR